jgi:hypothetical protein
MLDMSTLGDAADVNPVIKFLPHGKSRGIGACVHVPLCHMIYRVWQELDYSIDICRVIKCGHIEHL